MTAAVRQRGSDSGCDSGGSNNGCDRGGSNNSCDRGGSNNGCDRGGAGCGRQLWRQLKRWQHTHSFGSSVASTTATSTMSAALIVLEPFLNLLEFSLSDVLRGWGWLVLHAKSTMLAHEGRKVLRCVAAPQVRSQRSRAQKHASTTPQKAQALLSQLEPQQASANCRQGHLWRSA